VRLSLYTVFTSAIALEEPTAPGLLAIDEAALAQMDRRAQNIKSKMLISCAGLIHFTSASTDSLSPDGRGDSSFRWADLYETYGAYNTICSDHNLHNLAISLTTRPQFVHKTAIDFLTSSSAGHRFLMQYQVSQVEVLLALCKAHGSLLCFDSQHLPDDYRPGFRGFDPWPTIKMFLPKLEENIHLRSRLYQTVDRLLDLTIELPLSQGQPMDIILAGPLGAPWFKSQ